MKAYIKAISRYLPHKYLTNDDLVKRFPEWTVEKISSKVGISQRYVAAKDETATDMAISAAENLFSENTIPKNEIDYLLFCTQSPDYFLPTSACIIQQRLGLPKECAALDFNLGCSGYVYGLSLAKGLILAGIAKNVLLLTSETYSKYIHPKDKGNRTIFSDAATATIISTEGEGEILSFSLGTDGSGAENLIVKTGGAKNQQVANDLYFDENLNPISSDYLYMNGSEIFNFTIDIVPSLVDRVLEKNNLIKNDISLFVFHQANAYMLNYLRRKMKVSEEDFFISMNKVGNTVSSSIPIALIDAKTQMKLSGKVMLVGFGVGYSWGATIIDFE